MEESYRDVKRCGKHDEVIKIGFMLCQEIEEGQLEKQNLTDFVAQKKMDGMRAQATIKEGKVSFIGRESPIEMFKFPELQSAFKDFNDCILDGEIIVQDDFDLLISRAKTKDAFKIRILSKKYPATFVAFDILKHEGKDMRKMTWEERNAKLLELTPNDNFEIATTSNDVMHMLEQAHENNWEGIVIKLKTGTYEEARSPLWIKVKRKEYPVLKIIDYQIHNKGLTLISDQGIRVACNGAQSGPVKMKIDKEGSAMCKIAALGGKLKSGKFRQPTFVSMEA